MMEVRITDRLNKLFLIATDSRGQQGERESARALFWRECEKHKLHSLKVVGVGFVLRDEPEPKPEPQPKQRKRKPRDYEAEQAAYKWRVDFHKEAVRQHQFEGNYLNRATDAELAEFREKIVAATKNSPGINTAYGRKILYFLASQDHKRLTPSHRLSHPDKLLRSRVVEATWKYLLRKTKDKRGHQLAMRIWNIIKEAK